MDFMKALMDGMGGSDRWEPYADKEKMVSDIKAAASSRVFDREKSAYKIGDIITPRVGSNEKGRGLPHVVTGIYECEIHFPSKAGEPIRRNDLIVMVGIEGCAKPTEFLVDSANYEPFVI